VREKQAINAAQAPRRPENFRQRGFPFLGLCFPKPRAQGIFGADLGARLLLFGGGPEENQERQLRKNNWDNHLAERIERKQLGQTIGRKN
jgi:hypothetical protein